MTIRYKPRPKPEGLELSQSQIENLPKLIEKYQRIARIFLEHGTPENRAAMQQIEMTLAGWVAPLLHDYQILLKAVQPFGAVWDAWMIEREKRDTPFHNFNRFAVHQLDDPYVQHFRNATEIFDSLKEDDMPTGGQLWDAGYQGDEF